MNSKTTEATEKENSEEKTNRKHLGKRITNASIEFVGGMADAFSVGIRKFGESATADDANSLDKNNGIVKGLFEGYASLFEKTSDVFHATYAALTDEKVEKGKK